MPKYDLDALGSERFEELSQALAKKIVGEGVIIYGSGPDGGREAVYSGKSNYPSKDDPWQGNWIFQAKFHNVRQIGPNKARKLILADLDDELSKVVKKYGHDCDNYILITNVTLTPTFQKGTRDIIDNKIIPKYENKIKKIHIWGADDICTFLDEHTEIRQSFSQFLVSGDIISKLMKIVDAKEGDLDKLVRLYSQGCFSHEKYAYLDDSGDDERIALHNVFIDLNVEPTTSSLDKEALKGVPNWQKDASKDKDRSSIMSYLLDDSILGLIIVGGPGQGKSTLVQQLSQIYRARLIGGFDEWNEFYKFEKCIPRIPFRIILKEYAQWTSTTEFNSIFDYIARQMKQESGKEVTSDQIHDIIENNPILLVLDGLDEVPNKDLRENVLCNVNSFIEQAVYVLKTDIKVVATTRPYGDYLNEFDPAHYLHLNLEELTPEKSLKYAKLWINARNLEMDESTRILDTFNMCLDDNLVNVLTKTPLQLTMILFIISARGVLPNQREDLFNTYTDMIYIREQKKLPELLQTEKTTIYNLHKYLAFVLHRRAEIDETAALMDISEFESIIKTYLKENNGDLYTEPEISLKVNQIVTVLKERLVLIESPQEGKVGFSLTSIREFFTAVFLVDTAENTTKRFSRFETILTSLHWHNVALFFAGRVGRKLEGEESNIINVCRENDNEGIDKFIKRGNLLTFTLLEDRAISQSRNILAAIDYALSFLENPLLFSNYNYHNPTFVPLFEYLYPIHDVKNQLKNLPKEQKRHIRQKLEKKMDELIPEKLSLIIEFYEFLFEKSEMLERSLKKLSESNDRNMSIWATKKAIENQIMAPWVVEKYEIFAEEMPIDEMENYFQFRHNYTKFKPYFNEIQSSNGINYICKIILKQAFISSLINVENIMNNPIFDLDLGLFLDFELDADFMPDENKENSYIFWALNQVLKIYFLHTNNLDKQYNLPIIANPEIREIINSEKVLSEKFIEIFKETDNEFITSLIRIHDFLLNPKNSTKYESMINDINQSQFSILKNFILRMGLLKKKQNYHKTLSNLQDLYVSKEDYDLDIYKLNEIINKKSHIKEHSNKLDYWVRYKFNMNFEEYLDTDIIESFNEWFISREIPLYSIIPRKSVNINCNDNLSEFLVTIARKQIALGEKDIYLNRCITSSENINSSNYSNVKNLFTEFLDSYSNLNDSNYINLEYLYSAAINFGFIEDIHLIKIYEIIAKEPKFPLRIENNDENEESLLKLNEMLKSKDEKVLKMALLSLNSSRLPTLNRINKECEKSLLKILWECIENNDKWISDYIDALSKLNINWANKKDFILDKLKNSDEEEHDAWCDVIVEAKYCNDEDKNALCDLILQILNSSHDFKKSALLSSFIRLYELSSELKPLEFDEPNLNNISSQYL